MSGRAAPRALQREKEKDIDIPWSCRLAEQRELPGRVKWTTRVWAGAGAESNRTPHVPRGMRSGARGGGESIPRALSWLVQGDSGLASWLLTQGSFHSSGRLSARGWRRSVRKADSGLWGLVGKSRCTGEALGRKGRCQGGATRKMNHSPPCLPLSFPESTREQALTLALCVIWCG